MSLIKNSAWNIGAVLLPAIVAFPVLGIISRKLGIEAFGVFTLIYALLGFASLLDMGISRALVRAISISRYDLHCVKSYLLTASVTVVIIGSFFGVSLYLGREVVATFLNVTDSNFDSVVTSLSLASIAIPLLLLSLVWQSFLEGVERFQELSIIKIIMNTLISLFPLIAIMVEQSIVYAVLGVLVARFISLLVFYAYTSREFKDINSVIFDVDKLKTLSKFGGWLTVSNIISPMMNYFDRFLH